MIRQTNVGSPTLHLTVLFLVVVFFALLMASYLLRVEIVATGPGRIVPASNVQVVQSEFDGKVTEILVREGQRVEKGSVLLSLDETEALSDLTIKQSELLRLQTEHARITALVDWLSDGSLEMVDAKSNLLSELDPGLHTENPYVAEHTAVLRAEIADFLSKFQQVEALAASILGAVAVTDADLARVELALGYQAERLATAKSLFDRGAANRPALLQAEEALAALEGEMAVLESQRKQQLLQIDTIAIEASEISTSAHANLLRRLAEIDSKVRIILLEIVALERRLLATKLTAPRTGFVEQLTLKTVGGVVNAGQEILRIVPTDRNLVIEALFENADIGFMRTGQTANLDFDAFPAARFGYVRGEVTSISSDAVEGDSKTWQYVVRVAIPQEDEKLVTQQIVLRPGMTAKVDVETGTRTIISYFFAPILDTIGDALKER